MKDVNQCKSKNDNMQINFTKYLTSNFHYMFNFFVDTDRKRLKYLAYDLQVDLELEAKCTQRLVCLFFWGETFGIFLRGNLLIIMPPNVYWSCRTS